MIHGLKIYTPQKEYAPLLSMIENLSITHLFISKELAEDSYFINQLPQHIEVALIFPLLYDSDNILVQQPNAYALTESGNCAKEEWVSFICPSQTEIITKKIEKYLQIAQKAKVNYLSIDFIRYFAFWEKCTPQKANELQQSCFCPDCIEAFSQYSGQKVLGSTITEKASYIINTYETEFESYKCQTIFQLVRYIRERVTELIPDIKLSLHLVPWMEGIYNNAITRVLGQDIHKLAPLVDLITPMCYAHMTNNAPEWIFDCVNSIAEKTETPILPSIQVSRCYRDGVISSDLFSSYIHSTKTPHSAGVLYWSGEELLKDRQKQEVIRRFL